MLKTPLLNTLVQILGKVVMIGVSLVTTSLLTRSLGLKSYGEFILITSVMLFFDTLADFGTKIIGVREAAKEILPRSLRNSGEAQKKVWINMAVLRIWLSVVSFSLGLIFIFSWSDLMAVRLIAVVAFLMIMLTSIAGSLEMVWQTKQKMEEKVVVETLFPILFLVGLWICRINLKIEIGLMLVFELSLIVRIITLLMGLGRLRDSFNFKLIDKRLMFKLMYLSWPMGVYLLLFTAYDRAIDATMISRFLGKPEVAMYGLSYKIYGALLQPAYFLMNSLFPILSSNAEGKRTLFWKSLLLMLGGGLLVVIGIEILAPMIINLLGGEDFGGAIPVLRLLVWAVLFSYLNHLFGFSLISRNGQKEMVGLGAAVLMANFGVNLWAIPRFGMMGAAGVTVMSEALAMALMGFFLLKKSK